MHRTGGTTAVLGFAFTQSYRLALQFTGKTGTLQRILVENRLKFRIFHCFRSLTETFLSVLQRFDEIVDCRDCFLLYNHTTFRVRYAFCAHRFLRDLPPDVIFLMNKNGERFNERTAAQSENAGGRLRSFWAARSINAVRCFGAISANTISIVRSITRSLVSRALRAADFKAFVETGAER